jgi:hypothetical protein
MEIIILIVFVIGKKATGKRSITNGLLLLFAYFEKVGPLCHHSVADFDTAEFLIVLG